MCMFTELCKQHFNVKLFNYIFDTLFFSILLDLIFTGGSVFTPDSVNIKFSMFGCLYTKFLTPCGFQKLLMSYDQVVCWQSSLSLTWFSGQPRPHCYSVGCFPFKSLRSHHWHPQTEGLHSFQGMTLYIPQTTRLLQQVVSSSRCISPCKIGGLYSLPSLFPLFPSTSTKFPWHWQPLSFPPLSIIGHLHPFLCWQTLIDIMRHPFFPGCDIVRHPWMTFPGDKLFLHQDPAVISACSCPFVFFNSSWYSWFMAIRLACEDFYAFHWINGDDSWLTLFRLNPGRDLSSSQQCWHTALTYLPFTLC